MKTDNKASKPRFISPLWGLLPLVAALIGCASIGNPSGGPRDEDPPRFTGARPARGAVNVPRDLAKASLSFNEIVVLKDAFENVVVSPAFKEIPRVSASGRGVTVEFTDSLLPNTTYTIDFGNAIADNNEGNILRNFRTTFSTGPELDSLRISGMVLGSRDLEPQQGMLVGLYESGGDSLFSQKPFDRYARTDDYGRFLIGGLKPGKYRLFAVKDLDADRHYANPEEDVAFTTLEISPRAERIETTDTIRDLRTGLVDTVVKRMRTLYLPNDVLLRSFNSELKRQYLVSHERVDSTRIRLIFNSRSETLPTVEFPGFKDVKTVLEKSRHNDTLTYWLPEPLVKRDTLAMNLTWLKPDSTGELKRGTDSLTFVTQKPKIAKKKKKKSQAADSTAPKPVMSFLDVSSHLSGSLDVFASLPLQFSAPPVSVDTLAFRLMEKVDTLWHPAKEAWRLERADTLNPTLYRVTAPWSFGKSYRLEADSLAVTDIYGRHTKSYASEFKIKEEDEYSSLRLILRGLAPEVPAFVELLTSGDEVVERRPVAGGSVTFPYVAPGKYYARVIEDRNGNGVYDTGNVAEGLQPEEAFYYPKRLNLRKMWDEEETWDVFATAIDLQKPDAVKKNKPDETSSKIEEPDEEEEDLPFDPTANPFDPNQQERRRRNARQQGI